ncbi:DNA helicase [Sarracenia purpurea var. burkii]
MASEKPGNPLFAVDVVSRLPGLKSGRFWKEQHDLLLLRAVLKHGYGRWQAVVDDKDLRVQEVICQELNLPFITLPVPGTSQAHDGVHTVSTEIPGNQTKGTGGGSDLATDAVPGAPDAANRAQLFQDSSVLYHFREMQRRQVEFIKKRVLLLEKALNAEYQKEVFGYEKTNETSSAETETEVKVVEIPSPCFMEIDVQTTNHLPQIDVITPEEISVAVCDDKPDRLEMARLYNEMCKVLGENSYESMETYLANKPAGFQLRKNLLPLETIYQHINRILSPVHQILTADSQLEPTTKVAGPTNLPPTPKGDCHKTGGPEATNEVKVSAMEPGLQTELNRSAGPEINNSAFDVVAADTNGNGDVEMEDKRENSDLGANAPLIDESIGNLDPGSLFWMIKIDTITASESFLDF